MANELRVGIVADASSLEGAMADAGASVEQLAARVKTASANMAEAQKAFGQAAAAGSAQAQAVLADYAQELEAAQAAQQQFAASAQQVTAALSTEAASANVAAESIGRVGASSRQAATAGIGILEGRMMSGNRAAATFLSTTLGLGPVLQAAFPVIGALAMVEVLVDIGKRAYDAYEKFVSLDAVTEKLTEDFKKAQASDFINVQSIETASQRMHEAEGEATNLLETAKQLHDISLKGLIGDIASGNFGGLGNDVGDLLASHKGAEDSAQKTQQAMALSTRQIELQHQLRDAQIEAAHAGDSSLSPQQKITAELNKQLAMHAELQRYTEQREQAMGNPASRGAGQELQQTQDAGAQAQARAASASLRAAEQQKIVGEVISESIEDQELAKASAAQIDEDLARQTEQIFHDQNVLQEQAKRADEENTRAFVKNREEEIKATDLAAQAATKKAAIDYQGATQNIRYNVQAGRLSPRAGAAAETQANQQEEDTDVAALKTQQSQYNPAVSKQQEAEYNKYQDEITERMQQGAQQRQQIANQEAQREQQVYSKSFDIVGNAFNSLVDKWLTGSERMSKAFAQFGDQIALGLINELLQMGEKWLAHEVLMTAQHVLGIGQRQAADTAAAAQTKAVQSAAAVAQVASYGAIAGAAVAAAYAELGPEIALPAGAAMMAAVDGEFGPAAAFAVGTDYVPRTGMAVIHEGERIIPSNQNAQITAALSGKGGKQGGDVHFHDHSSFTGIDGASVAGMARKHGSTGRREHMRQLRLMGLVQGG